jgi:hypothetical protein
VQFGVDYIARTRGTSTLSSPTVIVKIVRELRTLYPAIRATERLAPSVLEGEPA